MKTKTATAREQPSPANIGNGGKNSRRQPPAAGRNIIAQMVRNFCSNRLERKNWNTSEGRPFVPKKFPIEPRVFQFSIKQV